jgi:hypothetical protein
MSVNVCYHRIRISVKLTCDKMCGSVGAGGERVATAAGAHVGQHAGPLGRMFGVSRSRR